MDITPPKLLSEVIYFDFRKSKYITGGQLPEVKTYHQKSISRSQNVSPKVDFQKSKYITGSPLLEVKNLLQEVDFRKSKNIIGSRLLEVKKLILLKIFFILFKIYVF